MKLALALIVKGSDQEAEALDTCLRYSAQYVDRVFVTITHKPGEERNKAVEEVCKDYDAAISDFEWVDDFSKARNFNFSQVPKEFDYILWLDADDALRGGEKLRTIIEQNPADVYVMNYLYAFDDNKVPVVIHMKSQVIKNDGCVTWWGRVHEDLRPERELTQYFVKDVDRLHLSNPERHQESKERNLRIAEREMQDNPTDPRTYWLLANAYAGLGKWQDATDVYNTFLKESRSDEERYMALLRQAEAYLGLEDRDSAVTNVQRAIGLRPEYPDAYHALAKLYMQMRRFDEAAKFLLQGLTKKPPQYSILVYNPRDYDYIPLKNLANCYFELGRPDMALPCLKGCLQIEPEDENTKKLVKVMQKEQTKFNKVLKQVARLSEIEDDSKLQAEIEKLPPDVQSHPGICNIRNTRLIKKESTGKDLVIYCGYTAEVWNPDTAKQKGIGGSEEAVIWLSELLAEKGWNVTVYANSGTEAKTYGKVTYKPYWSWNYRDKQDAVIVWRNPGVLKYEINAPKILLDLHDVIPAAELNEDRLKRVTRIFVKSKYQRDLFPKVPDEKFTILPNGIDPSIFQEPVERDLKLVVNTSAPNRGIAALTDMATRIKAEVPDARIVWAYGWGTFTNGFQGNEKVLKWAEDLRARMKENGIEDVGRLSHSEVAKLYLKANVWAYPSGFGEIDCISLSKAMAAGAVPVTTDFAALGEKSGHGGFFLNAPSAPKHWKDPMNHDFSVVDEDVKETMTTRIIELLKNPPSEEDRNPMREWAQQTFDWNRIAEVWNTELSK